MEKTLLIKRLSVVFAFKNLFLFSKEITSSVFRNDLKNFIDFLNHYKKAKPYLGWLSTILLCCMANISFAQTASATWNLTSNGNATVTGAITGNNVAIGSSINTPTYSATDGITTNGWANDAGSLRANEYYEYKITPTTGNILTVSSVVLNHSISNGNWLGAVYYSYNSFATAGIKIGSDFVASTTTQTALNLTSLSLSVPSGNSFTIRVYGWESDGNNRKFRNRNVVISGTTCLIPTITGTTPGSTTGTGTVTLGATSSVGTISWYADAIGGTALGSGTSFTTPIISSSTTYYVESVNGTCSSSPRTAVLASVLYPEINVQGNAISIIDGDISPTTADWTDFSNVTLTRVYTIQNLGDGQLTLGAITFTGVNPTEFIITSAPVSLVPAFGSTTFTVTFTPLEIGVRIATINIASDDNDESNYDFIIIATGVNIDTDSDGVLNSIDNDDDNDGILDTIECGTCLSDPFINGSFESSIPLLAPASFNFFPVANVPGWQTSPESVIELWSSGFLGVPAAQGNQFAELNANVAGTLYQTFCLNGASGTITWSIKHRARSGIDQAFVRFGATLLEAQTNVPIITMVDDTSAWGLYSGTYIIPSGQTQIVLAFQAGYTGSGNPSIGNFIDDIQININQQCIDTDRDGIANIVDLDDENDGIPDVEEGGFKIYSNNTSTFNKSNPANWTDTNGNGINDYIDTLITAGTYIIPNTDGDAIHNYLDLDSDNDAAFDVDEAGLFNGDGDITGDGKGDGLDTDRDGILNLYDNSPTFGTTFRSYAQDTDTNGISDYLQLDSNSDGVYDINSGLYGSLDTNNDGKIDDLIDTDNDFDRDGILDFFDTNITVSGSPRDINRKLFLDFDGRNDYGQAAGVLGGLANASMMAWINLKSGYNTTGVVVGQNRFQIRVTNAKRLDVTVNSTTLVYATPLAESQWIHVGATYNGTTLKLFVNGIEVNSTALTGNIGADTSLLTIGRNPLANSNFFKGKIDEVRVFNTGLTNLQFQRMVYQEIQNTSLQVRGTIVPRDIESLPFTNLLRYYRMDVYKDDIIDDLTTPTTDIGTGMKIYNHKLIKAQEAPMPFVTQRTGNFAVAVNDPIKEIRGLDITDTNQNYSIVQVNHNIIETTNITSLGMFVDPAITITMNNNTKIQNDWYLKLDGKVDLVDQSQLVQTANSELDITSAGSIERDQKGQSNRFNYNYWSSPVGSISTISNNNSFTVNGVMKDGTNPASIQNINWTSGYNSAATSPITLSSYWIFKFQNQTPIYANWSSVGPNGTLLAAQGYTMKGSDTASANQNYTFVGKPNNGNITSPIAANNLNLCGNPYASALDSNAFITDNLSTTTGALYFWEHFSTNNSHNLLQYQGGYAMRTLVGGTPPVAPPGISGLGSSSRTPGRYVPVSQGFLIYGSPTGGNIVFNNSQRAFIKEGNINSNVLFRNNNIVRSNSTQFNNREDEFTEDTFSKIRLGFNSVDNYHRQILIGFMNENASNGIDIGYDAPLIDNLTTDMYFIIDNAKFAIQGSGFFEVANIYPLGITTATDGIIKFVLDGIENFDSNQEIYIHDAIDNSYHDIRNDFYSVNLPIGTFKDRFSLRFKNTTLSNYDFELNNGITVAFTNSDNNINIKNESVTTQLKSVTLFNILGQSIETWNIEKQNQSYIKLPILNTCSGTYIVKIRTTNGDINKKIIIK